MILVLEAGGGGGLGVDIVQDLLGSSRDQVGEGGASAERGAGSVGDDDLGLLPQQLGHVLVLGVPNGSGDDGDGDLAVVHDLDVLLLSILGDGPHDDVGHVADGQQPLVSVQQGHVASAAGGAPVDGELDLSAGGRSGKEGAQVGCGKDRILGDLAVIGAGHGGYDEVVRSGVSGGGLGLRGGSLGGLCFGSGLGLGLGLRGLLLVLLVLLEQLVEESHQFASFTRGVGPSSLIVSTNSTIVFWNFSPSEAETHSSLSLLGSNPYCSRTILRRATLLLAL